MFPIVGTFQRDCARTVFVALDAHVGDFAAPPVAPVPLRQRVDGDVQVFVFAHVAAQQVHDPVVGAHHHLGQAGVVQHFLGGDRYFVGDSPDVIHPVIPDANERPGFRLGVHDFPASVGVAVRRNRGRDRVGWPAFPDGGDSVGQVNNRHRLAPRHPIFLRHDTGDAAVNVRVRDLDGGDAARGDLVVEPDATRDAPLRRQFR